ncbi:hypothetical protein [Beggiatoa alba]|uniref:hypothetical protein n=1 Tax=Beggiatoa alba TaxID=1022 RepID=UPI0012FBCC3E|nr:hypothetical protein [Beggiatoa alba]
MSDESFSRVPTDLLGFQNLAGLCFYSFTRYQALLGNACLASSACRVQANLRLKRSRTSQAELGA